MVTPADSPSPLVAIVMGSKSDWSVMSDAAETLGGLGVPLEAKAISAHRAPDFLTEYVSGLETRGVRVVIAGAGGAAHLPGVIAARTSLPVLGVPIEASALGGLDSLLSIVQMPAGVPVATFTIGQAGAVNAAHFAARILGLSDTAARAEVDRFRANIEEAVRLNPDPRA